MSRSPGEMEAVAVKIGHLPATQEQGGGQRRDENRLHEIDHEKGAELHAAVFYEVTYDLGFALRQIKGNALGFGEPGCQEQQETKGLQDYSPAWQPSPKKLSLLADDLIEIQGFENHEQPDEGCPHGDLITDHLAGGAKSPEKCELIVGGKASQKRAVDPHGHHGKDKKQADIQFEHLELYFSAANTYGVSKGNCGKAHQGEKHGRQRSDRMQELVPSRRHVVFLEKHLQRVGQYVRESECSNAEDRRAVGSEAVLHYGRLLALHPGQERSEDQDGVD